MNIKFSTSVALFRWQPAAWLRVTGADAGTFLQGQFTNDLRALAMPGARAVYGLWLTVKGKVLADSFVLRGASAQEYWIGSYASPAAAIRERLESFVVADDVVIEDVTAEWSGVSVLDAVEADPDAELGREGGVWFRGRRRPGGNWECVYRVRDGEPAWVARCTGRWAGAEEIRRLRIEAGIPAIPDDLGLADLPNEGGLEAEAISYSKGCYLGQEVMARLKSLGQVRRRLVRVQGAGLALPESRTPLFSGGKQVGEMRSVAQSGAGCWSGLAMVSRVNLSPGGTFAFVADGDPVVRLLDAP